MYLYFPDTPRSNKMTKRIRTPHDSLLAVGGTAVIYLKNIQVLKTNSLWSGRGQQLLALRRTVVLLSSG